MAQMEAPREEGRERNGLAAQDDSPENIEIDMRVLQISKPDHAEDDTTVSSPSESSDKAVANARKVNRRHSYQIDQCEGFLFYIRYHDVERRRQEEELPTRQPRSEGRLCQENRLHRRSSPSRKEQPLGLQRHFLVSLHLHLKDIEMSVYFLHRLPHRLPPVLKGMNTQHS